MHLVGNVHLIAGGAEMISVVLALLEDEGIETRGNADIYTRAYKSFGVEEARELRGRASSRALGGSASRRIFVIATPSMTTEAQNALLKTLEEPRGAALFFFIVPSPQTLLSTLRSRSQILALDANAEKKGLVDAKEFIAAGAPKRIDMLKPLLEKGEDDRRDLGEIIRFLSSLEGALEKNPEGLHAVYRARKYMMDKGALVKPLLEQIALLVPVVKSSA